MAGLTTRQTVSAALSITKPDGSAGAVEGAPSWASSDETVLKVTPAADGMSAVIDSVAPSALDADGAPVPARVTVSADADLGAGVTTITGVSEDITVTLDPRDQASVVTMTLGTPADKAPAP